MRILAFVTATLSLGVAHIAHAQGLPPPYPPAPPVYAAPVAPLPVGPSRDVRAEPWADNEALLPQEIIGILRSTGFSPLSYPERRGRFYVLAAVRLDGESGRVTMDAMTGRFVRFVPGDGIGGSMAAYPRPTITAPRGLRPPLPLPNVSSRIRSRPATRLATPPSEPPATKADAGKTAENKAGAEKSEQPVEIKKTFIAPAGPKLLPTQPMPPAQGLE